MKVKKAVIPAAGLGTRFLPATKAHPKEMLPVVDKPAIQYVVEEAVRAGLNDILIITGRGKRSIEDHFDRSVELENFLDQPEQIEVSEPVAVSELDDVKVSIDNKVTSGYELRATDGVVTWKPRIAPGEKKVFDLVYFIDVPSSYDSGGL